MTTQEIKRILADKLRDEGWNGTVEDLIKVRKEKDATWIAIKDFEHIQYKVKQEDDDYFGKVVCITEYWIDDAGLEMGDCISFVGSKRDYKVDAALIELGYHIGTTF